MVFGFIFSLCFLFSLILTFFLFKVRKNPVARLLIIMSALDAFWILMEDLTFYVTAGDAGIFLQMVKFIGVIFIPPLFLLATNEYTNRNQNGLLNSPLIFVVPILSLFSVTTNLFPYPFLSNLKMAYAGGIPVFMNTREIGFWIHTYYSYALILLGCVQLMVTALRSPKLYRRQAYVIFAGTIISFAINIVVISLDYEPAVIDTTSISVMFTLIVFYWGLYRMPKSSIKPFARDLLIESIADIVIILDATDRIVDVNPAALQFLKTYGRKDRDFAGLHAADATGMTLSDVLSLFPRMETVHPTPEANSDPILILHTDLKDVHFRITESPIYDAHHARIGRLYMLHDVTQVQEYVHNLERLNVELALSDRIINDATEGVVITDDQGVIQRVNRSIQRTSGYSRDELIGQNPRIFQSGRHDQQYYVGMWQELIDRGSWQGEIWNKTKDGEIYPSWMSITSLKKDGGAVENYIGISTDITKIKKTEDALQNLAYYDPLTGLPNRTLFYERLTWALNRAKRNQKSVALLFADLDSFKVINDSLGHAVGDLLLKEAAYRIKSRLRESDTVSRFGGDDFAVILEDVQNGEDVKFVAEALLKEIQRPYTIANRELSLGLSIGIALAPEDEDTVEGMVRKAEAAMYAAKDVGGATYSFSSEEIEKKNHETLEMQIRLGQALVNKEFRLHLQPQIARVDGRFQIVGAEALIRWRTADGVVYTPDKFIPLSERNGMIIPIGEWVLEEIFRIDRELKARGIDISLAINVSSKQFENGNFVARVRQRLAENRDQDIDLVIEVTESFLLHDLERAIQSLLELKELGIRIALDDFGTGFSSLSYLSRLPIDYLKIDKSFIADIDNPRQKNLTSSIISMAKIMNLKTVAEGVETQRQIDKLVTEGCNELQGYYFSKPLEVEKFIEFTALKLTERA